MSTNLPQPNIQDSARATKLFFDTYGIKPIEFSASEVESSIGFFVGKGFDHDAALVVATTLLKQAKSDNVPIFQCIDTLKGFTSLQISSLVAEILNKDRVPTSTLGFRTTMSQPSLIRNILP